MKEELKRLYQTPLPNKPAFKPKSWVTACKSANSCPKRRTGKCLPIKKEIRRRIKENSTGSSKRKKSKRTSLLLPGLQGERKSKISIPGEIKRGRHQKV